MDRPIGPQDERSLMFLNRSIRHDPIKAQPPKKLPDFPEPLSEGYTEHYEREIRHLNDLNQRLSNIVREYQKLLGVNPPELDLPKVLSKRDLRDVKELHDYPMLLNTSYYLSPLLLAYDAHLFNLEEEIKKMKQDSETLREINRKLMDENELLAGKAETQNLELQRIFTIKSEEAAANLKSEQEQQFEDRLNLLSEENQVLFEQVESYRVQFDALSKSYEYRMREMSEKIGQFDAVQEESNLALSQLQEARGQIEFLQKKMGDLAEHAGALEVAVEAKDADIKRLTMELQRHKEYHLFYKGEYNDLEKKNEDEMKRLTEEIREIADQRDDQAQKVAELLETKRISENHIKTLEIELATARQDVATLMKVSEDFQQKFDVLTDKEAEINEKNREYMRKIQELNIERDRCSLNEKKLQREIEKLLDEHRDELRTRSERYEKMLKAAKNGYEERLQTKEDEIHRFKMENEELDERAKLLEDQLKDANYRIDQLYKLEAERKAYL